MERFILERENWNNEESGFAEFDIHKIYLDYALIFNAINWNLKKKWSKMKS